MPSRRVSAWFTCVLQVHNCYRDRPLTDLLQGTGEAIRGNFNAAVDQAGGDRAGVNKNAAIATKGADEIEHGYHRTGHGAGVTPVNVDRERLNTTQTTSTNYGSHSTNTANKLDPRFDSDLDHRANPNSTIK